MARRKFTGKTNATTGKAIKNNSFEVRYTDTGISADTDWYGNVPLGEYKIVMKRLHEIPAEWKNRGECVSDDKVVQMWMLMYIMYSNKWQGKRFELSSTYFLGNGKDPSDPDYWEGASPYLFSNRKQISSARKRLEQIGVFEPIGKRGLIFHRNLRAEGMPQDKERKYIVSEESSFTEQDKKDVEQAIMYGIGEKEVSEETVESTERYLAELEARREKENVYKKTGLTEDEMWNMV